MVRSALKGFLGARQQGARAGSAYIAGSFAVSGVLTYVFQSISARSLGLEGYGGLAILWSATFLTVQVLWIGITQTLGRFVAEREAQGQDWRPVITSARRLQILLLAVFVTGGLLASPFLTRELFGGSPFLTAAFIVAVAAYAPEYFRRGTFGGHRQFSRLGALHVAESSSRVLLAAGLLALGVGVAGPAIAIVLAPLAGVLVVRLAPVEAPEKLGTPFSGGKALRFAGPVLVCVACAQTLANGGPVLIGVFGGSGAREQAGLLLAALILTRAPQYVLSPAIAGLLPHASRTLATEGRAGLDRFVGKAVAGVGAVGVVIVGGTWLFGELGMSVLYGPGFEVGREVLVALALLAAFYILCEVLNQALFARGLGWLAALGWFLGLPVTALVLALLDGEILHRVSYALALGALAAAIAQTALYLLARRRPAP